MVKEILVRLARQYACQLQHYKKMHEIVNEKHQHCDGSTFNEEEDLDKLNTLLARRREIMEQIEESQGEVQLIKQEIGSLLGIDEVTLKSLSEHCNSLKEFEELRERVGELDHLLKEILELDKKSQAALDLKLGSAKENIDRVKVGKKVSQAYNPGRKQVEGVFIDYRKK